MTPASRRWELTPEQADRYAELLRASDPDALHQLLLRHGPAILDRDMPYLVVAARNQGRSAARRGAARHELPSGRIPESRGGLSLWDPLAVAVANETMRELLTALGALDERDLLVLWSHAAGRSDAEIARRWDELGFHPQAPSIASIRKRRQRVRERLRDDLGV